MKKHQCSKAINRGFGSEYKKMGNIFRLFIVVNVGIAIGFASAQSQEIRWEGTYIEPDSSPNVSGLYYKGMEFVQDTNGDIYCWGVTGAGYTSAVSRIDEHGKLFWSRKFGDTGSPFTASRSEVRYIEIVDTTLKVSGNYYPILLTDFVDYQRIILSRDGVVLDSFASRQFQTPGKSYGFGVNSHFCQAPSDSEFIVVATSENIATWFHRIRKDDYLLQQKQHHKDVHPYYEAVGLTPVAHNRFILRGDRTDDAGQFRRPFLACFDSAGNILWEQIPADTAIAYTYCRGLAPTGDGGMILSVNPFVKTDKQWKSTPLLFRLDSLGNTLWKKELLFETGHAELTMIELLSDSGFMAVGYTAEFYPKTRAIDPSTMYPLMLRLDAAGNILWRKSWSGSDTGRLNAVHRLRDGSYGVVGLRFPHLYVASIADIPTSVEAEREVSSRLRLEVLSNSRTLRVEGILGEEVRVSLVDMLGRLVWRGSVAGGTGWVSLESLPSGTYVAVADCAGVRKSAMIPLY